MPHKPKPKILQDLDLVRLLQHLRIDYWNYLLIGDGSGSQWDHPCGWSCVQLRQRTGEVTHLAGSFSRGTNIVAEMMAYVQPILELACSNKCDRNPNSGRCHIHVVTDCKHLADAWRVPAATPRSNRPLWRLLQTAQREHGMVLRIHHMRRESLAANVLSHYTANCARVTMPAVLEDGLAKVGAQSAYEMIPPYDTE